MNKVIFIIIFILMFGLPWLLFYYLISKFTKSGIIRIFGGFISGVISLYIGAYIIYIINEWIDYDAAEKAGFMTIEEHKKAKSLGLDTKEQYQKYVEEQARFRAEQARINAEKARVRAEQQRITMKNKEREEKQKRLKDEFERLKAEEQCKKDLKCLAEKNFGSATVYCSSYIEKLAKYDFKWTDSGWLETKFSHFRWKDREKGVITYIGDKAMFQNGFGAWQNHIYECDFSTNDEKVLDIRARPGRL